MHCGAEAVMMSDAEEDENKERMKLGNCTYLVPPSPSPSKIAPDNATLYPTLPPSLPPSLLAGINRKCGAQALPVYPEMGLLFPEATRRSRKRATARIAPATPSS